MIIYQRNIDLSQQLVPEGNARVSVENRMGVACRTRKQSYELLQISDYVRVQVRSVHEMLIWRPSSICCSSSTLCRVDVLDTRLNCVRVEVVGLEELRGRIDEIWSKEFPSPGLDDGHDAPLAKTFSSHA